MAQRTADAIQLDIIDSHIPDAARLNYLRSKRYGDVKAARTNPTSSHGDTVSLQQCLRLAKWTSGLGVLFVIALLSTRPQKETGQWTLDGLARQLASNSARAAGGSSAGSSAGECGEGHHQEFSLNGTLAFVFICFLFCTFIDHLNLQIPRVYRFPISLVWFLFGSVVGSFFFHVFDPKLPTSYQGHGFDYVISGFHSAAQFNPHALLYILLPPLLYESASAMKWHVLYKVLPSSILLAVPGVMVNSLLTGLFVNVTFNTVPLNFQSSMLLASILSATDPVAVVGALQSLGAPAKLSTLVEGESLLNDGSAVVLFMVFKDWVVATSSSVTEGGAMPDLQCPGNPPAAGCVLTTFCKIALGGAGVGILAGICVYYWIGWARSSQSVTLELTIVLLAVYGSFFIAESLHISGVLAVVTLGMIVASEVLTRMSHAGRHAHHTCLVELGYLCNQVTFFVAGVISARFMWTDSGCAHDYNSFQAWLELFSLYIVIHCTRGAVVVMFMPLLKRWGYGVNWKEATILIWGGLRGAVGLIMGLLVEHDQYIDPAVKQMIAFHTSGIVLLTLLINGSTVDSIYKRLDMYPDGDFHLVHVRKVFGKLERESQKTGVKKLSNDWFFKKTVVYKTLVRCLPKFDNFEIDDSGTIVPTLLSSVHAVLQDLEEDANAFKNSCALRHATSFSEPAKSRWQSHKEKRSVSFSGLIHNFTRVLVNNKDTLLNVYACDCNRLDFVATEFDEGIYVSTRPCTMIDPCKDRQVHTVDGFNLKVVKVDCVQIIVGFVDDPSAVASVDKLGDSQTLGNLDRSIGFNLDDGIVTFNGYAGKGKKRIGTRQIQQGDTVMLKVQRRRGHDWEVTFMVNSLEGTVIAPTAISFGPFPPEELHPAVEFRVSKHHMKFKDVALTCGALTSLHLSAATNLNSRHASDTHEDPVIPCVVPAEQDDLVVSDMDAPTALCVPTAAQDTAQLQPIVPSAPPKASYEPKRSDTQSTNHTTASGHRHHDARVTLSYEMQTASDNESINEMFYVMFNTMQNHYNEMHEHGVLSEYTLGVLTESVAEALDNANAEVGSIKISELVCNSKPSSLTRTFTQMLEINSSTEGGRPLACLFEPLLIEYAMLERFIAETSWWDYVFPHSWKRFRLMGYPFTRCKVEALWAFVEAHQKVLADSPSLDRYPDFVKVIQRVIDEAKNDLDILEEIQPRRFFYSKHGLALRMLLNNRLTKLEKMARSGWISFKDCDGFKQEILKRASQVDQFFPRLFRSKSQRLEQEIPSSDDELTSNAWDDVKLN